MKFILKDYQSDAVADVLANLRHARDDFHSSRPRRSAFSLTAATGAGKTVMAAAVIEALFAGDDDFDFTADPGAVVLWFTSDPSLNEQTRHRIRQAADRIPPNRLKVIGSTFGEPKLSPGHVYFLNSQKLASRSLLVRGATDQLAVSPDLRARTFWEVLQNTIEDESLTLYVILDEAHRGMKQPSARESNEKSTIVRQLVNGEAGAPAVPIVLGISATVERFNNAMQHAQGRQTLPNVVVDSARVQESGLLKDDIRLEFPNEVGSFEHVLLKRAVTKVQEATTLWADYHEQQELTDDPVVPLLVVQVPNTPSDELLLGWIQVIREQWPTLERDAIAHVFGDHSDLALGPFTVPYISPEDVQERPHIRVLLAKDAITTGWDCPRAEVLVSFRPAQDQTHITQMLGRMVRTPLARRIPGDDRLNAVECILPLFNKQTATSVANAILGSESAETGTGGKPRVLMGAAEMKPNAAIPEAVWDAFDALPSETVPRKGAKPVKRLNGLAQALAHDRLVRGAHRQANEELIGVLDGVAARFKKHVEAAESDLRTVEGAAIVASIHTKEVVEADAFTELADERAVAADFKAAGRVLGAELARRYAEHLAKDHEDDDGYLTAHLQVAAIARVEGVQDELDRAADALTDKWLSEHRATLKTLPDERKAVYDELRAMAGEPQRLAVTRPTVRIEATKQADGTPVDTRDRHLMASEDGQYPIGELKGWETHVVDQELARADTVAWYRNPSRASADALAIAYQDAQGNWRRLCPDFVFFADVAGAIKPYIVDPHGHHLADALPKLNALCRYAAEYEDEFLRIEAVAEVNDTMRVLDLLDPKVRLAIADATDAKSLYAGPHAADY